MTLREQFEAWGSKRFTETWDMQTKRIDEDKRNLWQAYLAGHEASGRDELLEVVEFIADLPLPPDEIINRLDLDDSKVSVKMSISFILKAREAIAKARGE